MTLERKNCVIMVSPASSIKSELTNPPNWSMGRHGGVGKWKSRASHAFLTLGAARQISSLESASSRVVTHRHAFSAWFFHVYPLIHLKGYFCNKCRKNAFRQVIRRDLTSQDYRFGNDYYNPATDMIQLESARCPLKHQNEGYLLYLLSQYWKDSARVLKFENRGEVLGGKFSYENSRADKT